MTEREQALAEVLEQLVRDLNGENSPEQLNGYLDWLATQYNATLEALELTGRFEVQGEEEEN